MPNIFEMVTPKDIKVFYEKIEKPDYLGETLFPAKKQLGLELSFLKGRGGVAVQLQPAAFDALAPLRDRIGVEGFNTEMPFFRERFLISEKERQQLNTYLQANQTEAAKIILNNVYQDAKELIDGADVVPERMRMQLLATGKIQITGTVERSAANYDYGLTNDQKKTLVGTDAWTHADADPLEDIREGMEKYGAKRAVMNSFTLGLLVKHPKVIEVVGDYAGRKFVSSKMVKDYLADEFGLQVAVYDATYKQSQTAAAEKFFPDYVVSFIPEGTLGETVYGTTPEESDLLTGASDAEVSVVNTGVAVTTKKETHPVNVQTIVSEIVLPSFPTADKLYILTVGAA